jgi:nucleoid DNA-binding protein
MYHAHLGPFMASSAKTTHIAEHVAKTTGLNSKQSKVAVKATFEAVAKLLKKNERVTVTGMGTFSKKVKPATKGGKKAINPFTKQPYVTKSKPASTKVRFRAAKGFQAHVGK